MGKNLYEGKYVDESPLESHNPNESFEDISICTPFYNSRKFLNTYLHHVTLLDYPRDKLSFYFTVQGDDDTIDTLKLFQKGFSDEYRRIKIKKVKSLRGGELPHVRNVVMCRNMLIQWSKPDTVLFIDHDNFPPPFTILRLRETAYLGGDISGGIYEFYQKDMKDPDGPGRIGYTCFFIDKETGEYYHSCLDRKGLFGGMAEEVLGNRVYCDGVSMGTTLIQRKVFKDTRFTIPWGTDQTDDTTFCLDAATKGHKSVADFGCLVKHWGFDRKYLGKEKGMAWFEYSIDDDMRYRRIDLNAKGIYVVE